MENKCVSVVIPTYNRAKYITQSLDSVWEQTYRPIEVLVVDDGPTDTTKEVVEKWAKIQEDSTFKNPLHSAVYYDYNSCLYRV